MLQTKSCHKITLPINFMLRTEITSEVTFSLSSNESNMNKKQVSFLKLQIYRTLVKYIHMLTKDTEHRNSF